MTQKMSKVLSQNQRVQATRKCACTARMFARGAHLPGAAAVEVDDGVIGDGIPADEQAVGLQVLKQARHRGGQVNVVQGIAGVDDIEFHVRGETEILGDGNVGGDSDAVGGGEPAGGGAHAGRDVGGGDVGAEQGEVDGGFTEPATDIEQGAALQVAQGVAVKRPARVRTVRSSPSK